MWCRNNRTRTKFNCVVYMSISHTSIHSWDHIRSWGYKLVMIYYSCIIKFLEPRTRDLLMTWYADSIFNKDYFLALERIYDITYVQANQISLHRACAYNHFQRCDPTTPSFSLLFFSSIVVSYPNDNIFNHFICYKLIKP
jgi:hypothetical protein